MVGEVGWKVDFKLSNKQKRRTVNVQFITPRPFGLVSHLTDLLNQLGL